MKYMKIAFTSGITGEGYMVVDGGAALRVTDLDGNTILDLSDPEADLPVCEYHITDKNPATPEWANV